MAGTVKAAPTIDGPAHLIIVRLDPTRPVRTLLDDGGAPVLLTVATGGFLTVGAQMLYPVLLPHLRGTYGFDLTTGGLLVTVLFLSNSLFQFPSGLLTDAVGERKLMSASSVLCAASVAVVAAGGSTMALFAATVLLGIGISGFTLARMSLLPKAFPERVGSAVGLTFGAADAGQAVLPAVAGLVAATLAWPAGFAMTAPLFGALAVASWIALPRADPGASGVRGALDGADLRTTLAEVRRPTVVTGTAIIFLFAALWMTFSGLYPEYLVQEKGLTPARAGLVFGWLFALGMLVKPVAGGLFDRYGARATIGGLASVSAGGLLALWTAQGFVAIVVATALVSPYLGTGTVGISLILDALPDEVTGTGLGVIRTLTFSVAALGPVLVGALADRGLFAAAFLGLVALPAIMLLMAIRTPAGAGA